MENTDRQVRQHSEQNHVKVLMQRDQVSHLIGKGGAVIKEFVRRSGAFIKFETPTQGSPRQYGRLSGNNESMANLLGLMAYHLSNRSVMAEQKSMITPALTLVLPSNKIGLVVGKAGATLHSIQDQTGVHLRVGTRPTANNGQPMDTRGDNTTAATPANDGVAANEQEQEVYLNGTAESIYYSARLILGHIFPKHQHQHQHQHQHGSQPYGNNNTYRNTTDKSSGYRSQLFARPNQFDELEAKFALRPADVSRIIGKGGAGIKELCTSAHVKLVFDKKKTRVGDPRRVENQLALVRGKVDAVTTALTSVLMLLTDPTLGNDEKIGAHSGPDTVPMTEDNAIFNMMIPTNLVGFLVGKQGARINETKNASGADIRMVSRQQAVFDPTSGAHLQNMVVSGTKSCVIDAVSSLVSQLEEQRLSSKNISITRR